MGALPRPALREGPARDLNDALHDLHHRAGWPSLRQLGRAAGCSHTTVSHAFSSERLPSWGVLELLVEAMGGDVAAVHRLWLAASEPAAARPSNSATPIAGRRDELAVVRRHLTEGRGLLLVVGEGGIGKTTLVRAALDPGGPLRLLVGRSLRLSSDVPFLPVAGLLREAVDTDGGAWLGTALEACAPYVARSLARLLPELDAESPGPDDGWSRQRLLSAVRDVLRALASIRPAGVLVEDVHWADRGTLDVLEHLASNDPGLPIIATTRPDGDPEVSAVNGAWSARLRHAGTVCTLELAPLTLADTARQLELLGAPADREAVRRIYLRTRGQPLFTEQLVSYGDQDGLPSPLSHLLDQRLASVSPDEWQVLLPLALAGPLGFDELARVAEVPRHALVGLLRHLVEQRLVTTDPEDVQVGHPLLGEAILQRVLPGEAAPAHGRLARVLGAREAPPSRVAAHWEQAGDRAEELVWRVRAARAAELHFASASAARHWRRAIDLWPGRATTVDDPPTTLVAAYFAAMDALADAAQPEAAADLAQRAMALESSMTVEEQAGLYLRSADYVAETDDESALLLLDKAIGLLVGRDDSAVLHRALRLRAGILGELGRLTESLDAARRAATVSRRLDDPDLVRTSHMSVAWHEAVLGQREAARTHALEAAALASWREDPTADVRLSVCHTDVLLMAGAPVQHVEAAGRPGLEAVDRWQIDNVQSSCLRANLAEALRRAGRVHDAGRVVDPWTEDPRLHHRWPLGLERSVLDVMRGRPDDARAGFEALQDVRLPSLLSRTDMTQYTALADLWLGEPQRALASVLDLVDAASRTEVAAPLGPLLVLAARACGDLADELDAGPAHRRDLLRALLARRRQVSPDPLLATSSPTLAVAWEAEVSRLTERQDPRPWLDSAAVWDRRGRPHEAAYARWRAAVVVLASGRPADGLLQRAAREAGEHVPLRGAIRATLARAATR